MPQNLFIDTNVFLSFFHLTSEDLEELRKLSVLLKDKRLKLWMPDQVRNEFERNREVKILDALKQLRDQRLNLQFPAVCRDYGEYDTLRQLQREYEARHASLISRIEQDVQHRSLRADQVIGELFNASERIPITDALIAVARRRVELGDPPGKSGSLGDAVNWTALIEAVPNREPLFFVTQDKDYVSPLHSDQFNAVLVSEWQRRKEAPLNFYNRLSLFFKGHYPKITLASEVEKDLLIVDLANSGNFARTHVIIAHLSQHGDFTQSQVADIVDATLSNKQVNWIASDPDVKDFLTKLLERYGDSIHEEKRRKIVEAMA